MQYIKKDLGSYNLHMIKTNRFRSIDVEVILSDNIRKQDITRRNFLSKILNYSSEFYKTRHEYSNAMQDLYGISVSVSNYRLGNYYNTDFNMTLLEEKYTEPGMLEKSIDFLASSIFKPNIIENKFDSSSFSITKAKMKNSIEKIRENSAKYSIIRMLENMDDTASFSLHSYGYQEDLEELNEANLYQYYQEFMNSCKIDIYVLGNFDFNTMEKLIREKFKFKVLKKPKSEIAIIHEKSRRKVNKIIESYPTEQANLCIGCKIFDLTDFEKNYALSIYTIILGGGGLDSKLFNSVRKEHSLCYDIGSTANKLDNLLIITAGIDKANFDKTVNLIKNELNNIENGIITEDDLDKTKNLYISAINEMFDIPSQIIASYYAMELLGSDNPETRKEKIQTVTIDDIVSVAKKIKLDTVLLLGGRS